MVYGMWWMADDGWWMVDDGCGKLSYSNEAIRHISVDHYNTSISVVVDSEQLRHFE